MQRYLKIKSLFWLIVLYTNKTHLLNEAYNFLKIFRIFFSYLKVMGYVIDFNSSWLIVGKITSDCKEFKATSIAQFGIREFKNPRKKLIIGTLQKNVEQHYSETKIARALLYYGFFLRKRKSDLPNTRYSYVYIHLQKSIEKCYSNRVIPNYITRFNMPTSIANINVNKRNSFLSHVHQKTTTETENLWTGTSIIR